MQLKTPCPRHARGQAGFTSVEILIASALSLLTLATALAFNRVQLFALRNQGNQLDVQTNARNVVDLFAREVRRAGMNPGCAIAGFSGIAVAKTNKLRIQSDFDGDGATTGTDEDITYQYSFDSNSIQRTANGTTDTLVSGLSLSGSTIRYFDPTGAEMLPDPSTGLTSAQRANVRRIRIQLSLAGSAVDPTNHAPLTAQIATDVDLRNHYFTNSTACP